MNLNVRPERPEDDEAPQLSNNMWGLAEKCWIGDRTQRPKAGDLCRIIDTTIADSQGDTNLTPKMQALHLPLSGFADRTMTAQDVTVDEATVTSHESHTQSTRAAVASPDETSLAFASRDKNRRMTQRNAIKEFEDLLRRDYTLEFSPLSDENLRKTKGKAGKEFEDLLRREY